MEIRILDPREVPDIWPTAGPMLQPAIALARGAYDQDSVGAACVDGTHQLWAVTEDDGTLLGAMVSCLLPYPGYQALLVLFLGGRQGFRWGNNLLAAVEELATRLGCAKIEFRGRPEWARVLAPAGYSPVAVFYEKVLQCNGQKPSFHS